MKHRTTLLSALAVAVVTGLAFVASPASADQGAMLKKTFVAGSQAYSNPSTFFVASKINPITGTNILKFDDSMRAIAVNNTWTKIGANGQLGSSAFSFDGAPLAQKLMSSADYRGSQTNGFTNLELSQATKQGGWVDSV